MRRQTDQQEIEDMRPVSWKSDGTPVRFEVVQRDQAQHPRPIGWDDDDETPIVSPLPEARIVKAQSVVTGSWSDRAAAFNKTTYTLSLVTGVAFVIGGAVFGPGLSFFALSLYFFGGFVLAWLIAYLLHTFVSAEGAQMADTLLLWQFLFREQQHRHGRYATPKTDSQRTLETVLLAAAVGVTVLAGLGLLVAVFVESAPR